MWKITKILCVLFIVGTLVLMLQYFISHREVRELVLVLLITTTWTVLTRDPFERIKEEKEKQSHQ